MKSSVKRCEAQGDAGYIAVIDTETNWDGDLMSIGVVIAHRESFCAAAERYYIITPECHVFSLYGFALGAYKPATRCSRQEAVPSAPTSLQHGAAGRRPRRTCAPFWMTTG